MKWNDVKSNENLEELFDKNEKYLLFARKLNKNKNNYDVFLAYYSDLCKSWFGGGWYFNELDIKKWVKVDMPKVE